MRFIMRLRRTARSFSLGLIAASVLLLAAACDLVNCDDCNRRPATLLFENKSTALDAPSAVAPGDTFAVTARTRPAFSGVGSVALVGDAYMLRAIAPVRDSTGCFRAEGEAGCIGARLVTDSARAAFDDDAPFEQTWRVVLEEGPRARAYGPPRLGLIVRMDSVRDVEGALHPLFSRAAWDVIGNSEFRPRSKAASVPIELHPGR